MAATVPKVSGLDVKPFYLEAWFSYLIVAGCGALAWTLCTHFRPVGSLDPDTVQTVAMAKLFAEGQLLEAYTRFSQPPVYPALMVGVIKSLHTTRLPALLEGFYALNAGLFVASVLLVYGLARRLIRKPYSLLIPVLYTLAPTTLWMAWSLTPHMAFVVLSLAALWQIDRVFSKKVLLPGMPGITRWELVSCCMLVSLCLLTHPAGYFLWAAFFAVMLKRFGLQRSGIVASLMTLCLSPFIGRDIVYVVQEARVFMAPALALAETADKIGWIKTLQTAADQLMREATRQTVGDLHASPVFAAMQQPFRTEQLVWLRCALGGLLLIGLFCGLTLYTGITSLYLAVYVLAGLILLPPDSRMILAPVLPLLLLKIYYGVMRSGDWLKQLHLPVSLVVGPALTGLILLCTVSTLLSQGAVDPETLKEPGQGRVMAISTAPVPATKLEVAQKTTARQRALNWLSGHSPKNARVASPKPDAMAKLGLQPGASWIPEKLQNELSHYDYLVEEGSERYIPGEYANGERGFLKLVYEDGPGMIRIWQIQPGMR